MTKNLNYDKLKFFMNALNMSFDDFAMGAISGDGPEFWDLIKMPEDDYIRYIQKLLAEEKDKKHKKWLIDAIDSIDKQHFWTNEVDPLLEILYPEGDQEPFQPLHRKGKDKLLWSDPKDEFG